MLIKIFMVLALLISNGPTRTYQTKQGPVAQKWIDDKVEVRFNSGYLTQNDNLVLTWIVKNRTGTDIEISFEKPLVAGSALFKEPARIFLKRKDNQSAIRVDPSFVTFLDDMIPEDLSLTFRLEFPIPYETKSTSLFQKKPTWRDILFKHMGNVESIILYVPDQKLKITFPMP